MIKQSAEMEWQCSECDSAASCYVIQLIFQGELRWDAECECETCGMSTHSGGTGEAPQDIRSALLTENGLATLLLPAGNPRPVKLLKVLREAIGGSYADIRSSARELVDSSRKGTLVEMEFLAIRLREQRIEAEVVLSGFLD